MKLLRWALNFWIGADLRAAWQYLRTGEVHEGPEEDEE